jgi:uncharacterized protein YndB with AHSA1/START domain
MSKNNKASSAKKNGKKSAQKAGGAVKKKVAKNSSSKKVSKPAPKKKPEPAKKIVAKKTSENKTKPKVAAKLVLKKGGKPSKPAPAKASKKTSALKPAKGTDKKSSKEIKKIQKVSSKVFSKPAKKVETKVPVKDGKKLKIKDGVSAKIKDSKELKEVKGVKIEKNEKILETVHKPSGDGKAKGKDVLAITNTIPKAEVPNISASKIASISSAITNPVRRTDSYSIKPEKEPAGKYEMEFVARSSPEMLYEFLSTPSGLSEWFCDDVNIRNGIYTFIWDGQLQQARLLKTQDDQLVRFQWVDKTDGSYFEFKIQRDDLTNDISLIITDFAESAAERESAKLLWQSQVEKLLHVIGSIF